MSAVPRILDANANRAREALRVMEDAARFGLDDSFLTEELKNLRHDLRAALALLPPGWLEANRDVRGDVGMKVQTPSEYKRTGMSDVVRAAAKRLEEALRAMEEVGKTVSYDFGWRIESMRYSAYNLEQLLLQRTIPGSLRQWTVCVVLTADLCVRPWREVLTESLQAGADCVQVREKEMSDRWLLIRVRKIVEMAHAHGASVVVNDRADIALAAGADGVHVGNSDLTIQDVRQMAGTGLLVGASVHTLGEAEEASAAGADYCGVGTIFASEVKPDRKPQGPSFFKLFVENFAHMPHLAIGGITSGNVHHLAEVGCRGVAVSSAVCRSAKPGDVVARLREALVSSG